MGTYAMTEQTSFYLGMFRPYLGDAFRVKDETVERSFKLIEATPRPADGGDDTRNFNLVFLDPEASVDAHLPQRIYQCEHDALGTVDLFLVPIGRGHEGVGIQYEAVFANAE